MMTIKSDSHFKRELAQLCVEIKIEDFLSRVSEKFEALELCESAKLRSNEFGEGFLEGFMAAQELSTKYDYAREQSVNQKYDEFNKRWGILDII